MDVSLLNELTSHLSEFVSEDRIKRIEEVLNNRTRQLTVVLEDIYQPHNASAVLRTCDAFGVQDVHIIENRNAFKASQGVTIGADRWLSMYRYNSDNVDNTSDCFKHLKEEGFVIVATTPHTDSTTIDQLPADRKTALVFGAELEGLSEKALKSADEYIKIPMFGFSESFNISVSAALCLYDYTTRMREINNSWMLKDNERDELRYAWIKQSVKAGPELVKRYLKEHYPDYRGNL